MAEISQITDEEVPRRINDEEKYYKIIAETFARQSKIDVSKYEATLPEIGRQIIANSGGPLSAPAQEAYNEIDENIAKEKILPRIDDGLIEEHRENPIGGHSDDLEHVLNYFRRQPMSGKYVILEVEKFETFYLGQLTGNRGEKPEKLDDPLSSIEEAEHLPYPLTSVEQAEHAIFLKRIEELRMRFSD